MQTVEIIDEKHILTTVVNINFKAALHTSGVECRFLFLIIAH